MTKTSLTILFLLIVFSGLSCVHSDQVRMNETGTSKEFKDPSQTILVSAGEQFSIALDSNMTTGYSWQMAKKAVGPVVKFIGSDYRNPVSNMAGAGGVEHWTFIAQSAGTEQLTFRYLRPWEKDVEPARTVTFTIVVE